MSHIKVLPIVPVKQAETFDDEIDEQQHLRKWLSALQRVESAKRAQEEKKESTESRLRLYSFD